MTSDDHYLVQDYVPTEWPPDVVESLRNWRQGDLLPGHNLSWLGDPADKVTGEASATTLEAVQLEPLSSGWLVVTSQTCDIVGTGTGSHHPFVQVCPVLDATDFDTSRKNDIKQYKIGYLVPLSRVGADEQLFAADLRMSMPVSKGVLASAASGGSAFASELDRINFAEALAIRARRAALHDDVSESFIKAFSGHFKGQAKAHRKAKSSASSGAVPPAPAAQAKDLPQKMRKFVFVTAARIEQLLGRDVELPDDPEPATGETWWREVEQVRLVVHGDRLRPTSVQMIVVTCRPFAEAEKEPWWSFAGPAKGALKPAGIKYDETVIFGTLNDLSARLYKDSIPIRFSEIGQPPTF